MKIVGTKLTFKLDVGINPSTLIIKGRLFLCKVRVEVHVQELTK